ncbi:hypothetical protein NQ314_019210, partial [Rhamnusium bicolor]
TNETVPTGGRQILVNGQQSQTSALLQAMKANMEAGQPTSVVQNQQQQQATATSGDAKKQFVITPDYIQQTIKTALKQENLNPEIEEKLLQLQRYQEKQMKQEPELPAPVPKVNPPVVTNSRFPTTSRKRPPSASKNDDSDWVLETPKRSRPSRPNEIKKIEPESHQEPIKEKTVSPRARIKIKEVSEAERKVTIKTKIMVSLYRQKELLKKDILRKRALLEKELQYEIQREVAEELAARTKIERSKQDEVRTGSSKRKSAATATTAAIHPQPPRATSARHRKTQKQTQSISPPSTATQKGGLKREKSLLYMSDAQPYDESQFYICCDRCQDWFHGRCVGILQSEADNIDEYICPRCQRNNSVNFANMKDLTQKDFEGLRKLIKQLQVIFFVFKY